MCPGFLTGEPLGPCLSVPGRLAGPLKDGILPHSPHPKQRRPGPASEQLPSHPGPKRTSKTAAGCQNEECELYKGVSPVCSHLSRALPPQQPASRSHRVADSFPKVHHAALDGPSARVDSTLPLPNDFPKWVSHLPPRCRRRAVTTKCRPLLRRATF